MPRAARLGWRDGLLWGWQGICGRFSPAPSIWGSLRRCFHPKKPFLVWLQLGAGGNSLASTPNVSVPSMRLQYRNNSRPAKLNTSCSPSYWHFAFCQGSGEEAGKQPELQLRTGREGLGKETPSEHQQLWFCACAGGKRGTAPRFVCTPRGSPVPCSPRSRLCFTARKFPRGARSCFNASCQNDAQPCRAASLPLPLR